LYDDLNGNMTSDGTNSYTWNARNQLASMNFGNVSFQYDGYARRTDKTISSTTTNYLYDGANPVQELSGTTVTANLLTGLGIDERFARTDSNGTANFLTDALGSTVSLTNGSGSTLASYAYEPFGNTTVTSGSSANPYQYTGRENDGTGVYFYRARYYSPTLQRFISEDPIGMLGSGPNLYAYANNNPVSLEDPSGTDPLSGGIIGAVVGGFSAFAAGGGLKGVLIGAAIGGGIGAVAGIPDFTPGLLTGAAAGAAAAGAGNAIGQAIAGGQFSWSNLAGATAAGAIGGLAGGAVGVAGWAADVAGGSIELPLSIIANAALPPGSNGGAGGSGSGGGGANGGGGSGSGNGGGGSHGGSGGGGSTAGRKN
jgi:RHS repeat-associated protein